MKVRIKIIEKNNGTKRFIPQAKDKFSFLDIFFSMITLLFFGKLWYKYHGLTKIEASSGISDLLGIKAGEIIWCSDEEATFFLNYEEALAFLYEYAKQEKLNIFRSKEEALKAKMLDEAEQDRIKGEKIKKVKYIEIKSM
jgi:hypothetical protein